MTPASSSNDRLTAFGNQLIDVHRWLRQQLVALRDDLATGASRADGPRDLRAHCLAFCSALGQHHSAEDDGAFPLLANDFPELRPMLAKLMEDHRLVADILSRLQELAEEFDQASADRPADVRRVRGEVDGLSAILESHFAVEERQLVGILNALSIDRQATDTAGISRAVSRPEPLPGE